MKKVVQLLRVQFQSSSTKTKQFTDFARTFKKEFGLELARVGAELLTFNAGHFYLSGFFQKGDQLFYFCTFDVRGHEKGFYFRTAKSTKDYVGGPNITVKIAEGMGEIIARNFIPS